MRQPSTEQYFSPIFSSHEVCFCLGRKRLPIYQKTSDYVVKSDLILTDGLLDFQPLDEIKFFLVLYKTYIADTWVLRRKSLSAF